MGAFPHTAGERSCSKARGHPLKQRNSDTACRRQYRVPQAEGAVPKTGPNSEASQFQTVCPELLTAWLQTLVPLGPPQVPSASSPGSQDSGMLPYAYQFITSDVTGDTDEEMHRTGAGEAHRASWPSAHPPSRDLHVCGYLQLPSFYGALTAWAHLKQKARTWC